MKRLSPLFVLACSTIWPLAGASAQTEAEPGETIAEITPNTTSDTTPAPTSRKTSLKMDGFSLLAVKEEFATSQETGEPYYFGLFIGLPNNISTTFQVGLVLREKARIRAAEAIKSSYRHLDNTPNITSANLYSNQKFLEFTSEVSTSKASAHPLMAYTISKVEEVGDYTAICSLSKTYDPTSPSSLETIEILPNILAKLNLTPLVETTLYNAQLDSSSIAIKELAPEEKSGKPEAKKSSNRRETKKKGENPHE